MEARYQITSLVESDRDLYGKERWEVFLANMRLDLLHGVLRMSMLQLSIVSSNIHSIVVYIMKIGG